MKKNYKIIWLKPDFESEIDEYFENAYTQRAFSEFDLKFKDKDELIKFLSYGKLRIVGKDFLEELDGLRKCDNLTLNEDDFETEIENPDYYKSYRRIENKLLKDKIIHLPAPILIKFGEIDFIYGFSGNRRMNLAWRYNNLVNFWVVNADLWLG